MGDKNFVGVPQWQDDQTMAVLFSPFRENRDVNPNSWDRKMSFWTERIQQVCQMKTKAVFYQKELPKFFERKGKVPVGLGVVVKEMIR